MGEYTDIGSMSKSLPSGTGQLSQADDHMRGIKTALKNTFPEVLGVVTANTDELNSLDGLVTTGSIEDRFTDLEAYFDYLGTQMTVAQMSMLWDLETNTTVEGRIASLEDKTAEVSKGEITALKGYDIFHSTGAYIENRFQALERDVSQLQSNSIDIWTAINLNTQWRAQRESILANQNLYRIASYIGANLPLGYSNDLGSDFQLIANKVEQLEYLAGYGVNPGQITWKTLIANLNGGSGGINVTNQGEPDSWGFVMRGLLKGTKIDFRFFDGVQNQYGKWASEINNGSKQLIVDESGEVNANIRLGSALFGPNDTNLTPDNWGRVEVEGLIETVSGQPGIVTQSVYCAFY